MTTDARSQAAAEPSSPVTGMGEEYRVRLEAFEGPLDLLLHLIRRAEVDIEDVPLARITDQYLSHLAQLDRIDIDLAGEFLVMAATLMEIKSRLINPPEEGSAGEREARDEDAGDPRAELIRQLLEYKKYRDAADALEARREVWSRRVPVAPAKADQKALAEAIEDAGAVEMDDLDLLTLVAAFERIAESVDFGRVGEHEVVDDDTPIELHAEDLLDRLQREGEVGGERGARRLPLAAVFEGRTRSAMLGLFLALLELLKQQRAGATQEGDVIWVELREAGGGEAS